MIDWMTLRCSRLNLSPEVIQYFDAQADKLMKVDKDGVIMWCVPMRQNIRSDSHQISVMLDMRDIEISGSPARVMHDNNVFGSGNPHDCFDAMLDHVERTANVQLPRALNKWRCTRWDITHNYAFQNSAEVRQALSNLRHAEGGRLQVRQTGETIYWSPQSRHRSGKAYHKGQHLRYLISQDKATATDEEISLADKLLRLELTHRSHWFKDTATKKWWQYTQGELEMEHEKFFRQVIGTDGVVEVSDLQQACIDAANSEAKHVSTRNPRARGMAIFRTWCLIKQLGYQQTRDTMPKATFYRHILILKSIGLSLADLHSGNVIPLRRKALVITQPVRSWQELREAA